MSKIQKSFKSGKVVNREIAKRIFDFRASTDKSLNTMTLEVLEHTGVDISKSAFGRYENGKSTIPAYVIVALCNTYALSLDYILYGKK